MTLVSAIFRKFGSCLDSLILQDQHNIQNRLAILCFSIFSEAHANKFDFFVDFWCFNVTFSNISAISWRPVLVVEEAGVPGENHRPWASNW
jgi:hypothetical protein